MPDRQEATFLIAIEASTRKVFASAVDWPGWSRSGKTEALALEALAAYAERYAIVAREAGFALRLTELDDLEVVERVPGGAGTEFGVPSAVTELDRRPVSPPTPTRLAAIVEAAWAVFDRVVAGAPAELRKGPRGGGRDRDKIVGHVVEADWYYAREIGLRIPQPDSADRAAVEASAPRCSRSSASPRTARRSPVASGPPAMPPVASPGTPSTMPGRSRTGRIRPADASLRAGLAAAARPGPVACMATSSPRTIQPIPLRAIPRSASEPKIVGLLRRGQADGRSRRSEGDPTARARPPIASRPPSRRATAPNQASVSHSAIAAARKSGP